MKLLLPALLVVLFAVSAHAILGDLNKDGKVDLSDFFLLADQYGKSGPPEPPDMVVQIDTLEILQIDTVFVYPETRLAPPGGLRATGEIGRIQVNWSPSRDADLLGYNLYRAQRSDTGYERLEGVEGTPFTTGQTTYSDSNLTAGELYFYKVTAVLPLGETRLSAYGDATVLVDQVAPATPGDVIAMLDESASQVRLIWKAPTEDQGRKDLTGLASYIIFRRQGNSQLLPIDTLAAGWTEFIDEDLEKATTYAYAVRAVDPAGNSSPSSSPTSVKIPGAAAPSGLALTPGVGHIQVRWSPIRDADLLGYNLYRAQRSDMGYERLEGVEGTPFTTGQTTYSDSNLPAGELFYYKVSAVTSKGEGVLSTFAGVEMQSDNESPGNSGPSSSPGAAAPSGLALTPGVGRIQVRWSPIRDADLRGYNLYRSQRSDTGYELLEGGEGTPFTTGQTSYIDSNLVEEKLFYYKVSAVTSKGEGALSTFEGATTQSDNKPPAAPSSLQVSPVADNSQQLDITWKAPTTDDGGGELTGLSGYRVFRSGSRSGDFEPIGDTIQPTFRDIGLGMLTIYYYKVQALDEKGNVGPLSSVEQLTTGGMAPPSRVTVSLHTPCDTTEAPMVTISWQPPPGGAVLDYEAQRTTVLDSEKDADYQPVGANSLNTLRTDYDVVRGETYYYRIRARDVNFHYGDWTKTTGLLVPN